MSKDGSRQCEKLYPSTVWTKTDTQITSNTHTKTGDVLFQLVAVESVLLTPPDYKLTLHSIKVDSSASSYTQSLLTVFATTEERNNTQKKTTILPESGS